MGQKQTYSMSRRFQISSKLDQVSALITEVQSCLKALDLNEKEVFDLKLAVEESLVNAIKHGNRLNEDLPVSISLHADRDRITISVEDRGRGFDHTRVPNPTNDEHLDRPHGRGIFLIKKVMDRVDFNKRGNQITMVKYISHK